jgi:hypothetical protein
MIDSATMIFKSLRLHQIQIRLANLAMIMAVIALLSAIANAGVLSFSVEANNGPFPSTIASDATFEDGAFTTIYVSSDPTEKAATGADLELTYSVSYNPVETTNCPLSPPMPQVPCGGNINYQISGPMQLDSGINGYYTTGSEGVAPIGEQTGILWLSAGTYTFDAIAFANVYGQDVTVNSAYGSIEGNFTVVAGDVSLTPEPGAMVLLLVATVGWLVALALRRWTRSVPCS